METVLRRLSIENLPRKTCFGDLPMETVLLKQPSENVLRRRVSTVSYYAGFRCLSLRVLGDASRGPSCSYSVSLYRFRRALRRHTLRGKVGAASLMLVFFGPFDSAALVVRATAPFPHARPTDACEAADDGVESRRATFWDRGQVLHVIDLLCRLAFLIWLSN